MPINKNVLLLALTSFLADVSGEMLMAMLPFLLVAQGATGLGIGLVSGLADAVGHAVKPFAGRLADHTGKRLPLIMGGYLLAALSRFGIALAPAWGVSLLFRASDRVGKGARSAPRDALLAESVPREERGRAFGLHRAADTAGAVVGVSLALAALALFGETARTTQAIVLLGAAVGLTTLVPLLFVREADASAGRDGARGEEPASPRFAAYVAVAALFALGSVSYMFFVLRATGAAGGASGAVALYLLFNLTYVAAAYPAGQLADRVGRERILLGGWLLFALTCALFALQPAMWLGIVAFALMGVAFAGFEGVQRALAADLAGTRRRSTQLGVFHAAVGGATLVGGLVGGLLWDQVGQAATFVWGATVALLAAALLPLALRGR